MEHFRACQLYLPICRIYSPGLTLRYWYSQASNPWFQASQEWGQLLTLNCLAFQRPRRPPSSHLLNVWVRSLGLMKSLLLFSPLANYIQIHTNYKPKIIAQKRNVGGQQKYVHIPRPRPYLSLWVTSTLLEANEFDTSVKSSEGCSSNPSMGFLSVLVTNSNTRPSVTAPLLPPKVTL